MISRFFTVLLVIAPVLVAGCTRSVPSEKEKSVAVTKPDATPKEIKYERLNSVPEKPAAPETVPVEKSVRENTTAPKTVPVEQKADTPSPSLVSAYIESDKMIRYIARGDRFFKITKLEKTNGITNSFMGATTYRMEYKINVECLSEGPPRAHWGFNPIPCDAAGELISGTGFVDFEKTENGWRVIEQPPNLTDWFTPKRNSNP